MEILFWTIQLTFVPLASPLFVGVIGKIKALMQNRQGASIFQPYRNLRKLFCKDEIISKDASWIFRFAPYLIFATTLIIGATIPLISLFFSNVIPSDFLTLIYLLALGTFWLALSGIDVGSAFGGFGSSREMTLAALAEGGMIFSFLSLAILSHTTNLFGISSFILSLGFSRFAIIIGLAFFAFIIALLAENSRFPFDNPSTHLELTMVHEAMILEYSGKRLALMEWAAANKFLIFASLAANLFFPWGIASSLAIISILFALGILIIKILILCAFVGILESTIAKYRFFRLPDLLFTSFIISAIAIELIIQIK
jgi:formate hydrogenlyase subunit 4